MRLIIGTHDDDIELFAAFTVIREAHAQGVTCAIALDSHVQRRRGLPITAEQRATETAMGLTELGVDAQTIYRAGISDALGYPDAQCYEKQDLAEMEAELRKSLFARFDPEHVWAPAVEVGGHPHHNLIGKLAAETWPGRVTHYLGYTGLGKSTNGQEVKIADGRWIAMKLRAMACHESQFTKDPRCGCFPHFLREQREFYAR